MTRQPPIYFMESLDFTPTNTDSAAGGNTTTIMLPAFLHYLGQNRLLRQAGLTIGASVLALTLVPWQADEAACIKLAAMFHNDRAALTLAATAPQTLIETLSQASEPSAPAPITQEQAVAVAAAAITAMPAVPAPAPTVEEKTMALGNGQTLQGLLQAARIVGNEANAVANEIREVFDLRRLKAGQEITLKLRRVGDMTEILGLRFSAGETKEIKVDRTKNGDFDAKTVTLPTTLKRMANTGEVQSSLYEAAQNAGLPRDIMTDVMKIFAHKIDFQRDVHKGDKFYVLYEQNVTGKGTLVGDGQVIMAAIETGGKINRLYRYEFDKGQFDYFDEQGRTAKRGLLRTPVPGAAMTSGFGVRMHPILGYSKMHEGVDFGAAVGTPIFAAGDGVVTKAGWNGSYGRYIEIRHNNRLETAYAHMSRFADGLNVGDRVKQGQIIAYVGNTGRSTGPHLHYEVHIDGRKVNPMSVDVPTGRSLEKNDMPAFKRWREKLNSEFQALNQGLPAGSQWAVNDN